jgi:serine/threonine protein kinase
VPPWAHPAAWVGAQAAAVHAAAPRFRPPPCRQVYLITELVTGGELLEMVVRRGPYCEADARAVFVSLLRGIEYLHSK